MKSFFFPAILICFIFCSGCTTLGHHGSKATPDAQRVKLVISSGVVLEKVDKELVLDAAGSNMKREVTVDPGFRVFLVRYWKVSKGGQTKRSTNATELKKELQAGKSYCIVATVTDERIHYEIAEVPNSGN